MALPALIPVEDFFKPPTRAAATLSPDGTKLYVMTSTTYTGSPPDVQLEASGGVTVIDMRTMTAVARHRSGVSPFGGSIRYVGGKASSR